jgi:hypothetical protein
MSTSLAELKHEPEPDITPIPLMQLATAFWGFKTLSQLSTWICSRASNLPP